MQRDQEPGQRRRRVHLQFGLTGLALLLAPSCSPRGSAPERPDVLLVVIDTLRADRLGCYGYPRPTSPHLDALAERGVLFEEVWAQASWTLPSMSSMLTGRYYTAQRNRPQPEHPILAESFQKAGYHTLGVVANSLLRPDEGFSRGFDGYDVLTDDAGFEKVLERIDRPLELAAVRRSEGDPQPLFLYLHPFDPHAPYDPRPQFDEELPPTKAPAVAPAGWQRDELAQHGPSPPEDDPGWKRALRELRRRRGLYDQEVRYADEIFGRLLSRLDELELGDNLIIAVVSDHGEGLWEQRSRSSPQELRESAPALFFFQGHGQDLSEQALSTPFLLAGPGLPRGLRIDAAVENVDLFPTLLHLADLPAPGELHGRDLLPLVRAEAEASAWREERYAFVIRQLAVRDEKSGLKLVTPVRALEEESPAGIELYDLEQDPYEHSNQRERQPAAERELMQRARWFLKQYPTRKSTKDEISDELRAELSALGYSGDLFEEE